MEQVMNVLWNMSYRGTIVIIIVMLIRAILLRKFPRKYAFWLWGVVGLCLLFPLDIVSSVSIFNLLPDGNQIVEMLPARSIEKSRSVEKNRNVVREENKSVSNIGQGENSESDAESNPAQMDMVSDGKAEQNTDKDFMQENAEGNTDKDSMQENMEVQKETVRMDQGVKDSDSEARPLEEKENVRNNTKQGMYLYRFLFFGWLLGILVLFAWNLAAWLRVKRQIKSAVLLEGNVYECEDIPGPFVWGLISPKIYIPFHIEEETRKYILAHERYHIRRKDHWTKVIATVILAAYWFHSLVWAAYILMGRDMEMSCDERVLAGTDMQARIKYSESLLSFATNRRNWNGQRMAFDAHTTRRRVKNVLTEKRSKWYMGVVFGIVAGIVAVVLLTKGTGDGKTEQKPEQKEKQEMLAEEDLTELTVLVDLGSYYGMQEGWFGELLKQKFHVKLNISPFSGEMDSAGSDIFVCLDARDIGEDGSISFLGKYQRKLLPLSDGEYRRAMTISDICHEDIFYTWDLRYDLYQKCGRPQIKDWDSLREVLKEMQGMCKKKVYGASIWSDWDETYLTYAEMLCCGYYGLAANDFVLYDNEGNVYGILDKDGAYEQALHFLNQLYRDGLLDPDSRSNTVEEVAIKAGEGQTLWSLTDYMGSAYYNTESNLDAGKAMYPVIPDDAILAVYQPPRVQWDHFIAVNAETAHADLCKCLVDYLSSPTGMMEMEYGPEGLFWYYDEEGKTHFTEMGQNWYESELRHDFVIETDEKEYEMYDGMIYRDGEPALSFQPFMDYDINPDSGEKYDAEYWESYTPVQEDDNVMWEDWKADHHATQIQTYLEEREKIRIYSGDGFTDKKKPKSWKAVSKIIVKSSWDAVYADSEAEFSECIGNMIRKAIKAGYQECMEYSTAQVKERLQEKEK